MAHASGEGKVAARRDALLAAALGGASFILYLTTLCPTVYWYDSAEYATAAAELAIPHPPGYPLYTLLGRVFVALPVEPAYAVNLMSAVAAAVAVALAWLTLRALAASRVAAFVGAAALATSQVFWAQASVAEVYTPALAFLLGVVLLLVRGLERNRPALVIGAAGLAGLGLGVHLSIATCGLGLAFLVASVGLPASQPGSLRAMFSAAQWPRRAKVAAGCLGAALLGSCVFLYVPWRASVEPAMNISRNPDTLDNFLWFISGGNYKNWFLENYDWLDRLGYVLGLFYDQLLVVGLVLGAAGLVHTLRRQPVVGVGLALMAVGNVYYFFAYRVHDVEVFFLPTTVVLCLLAGLGADAILGWIERAVSAERAHGIGRLVRVALCLFPLSMAAANYGAVNMSDVTEARAYGETLCAELPEGAVVLHFTSPDEWRVHTVLVYFTRVLGRRPDVVIGTNMKPPEIARLLAEGRPMYLYVAVPMLLRFFELEPEGALFRVVRFRPPPGATR